MSILTIILVIVIVGAVLFVVERFIPMDSSVKIVLRVVVLLLLILYLLSAFGLLSSVDMPRVN